MIRLGYLLVAAVMPVAAFGGASKSTGSLMVQCSGGVAGIFRDTRLSHDGRLSHSDRWDRPPIPVGRMSPAEARALAERLEKVDFASLKSLPRNSQVRDGINCAITQSGARRHMVSFPAGGRAINKADALRYAEVRAVMSAILGAASRVSLNPQPIPPNEVLKR